MEGFTIIDGVVALFIVMSALLAYSRGLVREALAIAGWVAAGILAFIFAPQAYPLVKEIPVIRDVIGDNCELGMITAFTGVFAIALIISSFITPLFSSIVQRSVLGGLDQGLGLLFGVARGILLVAVAYFVYETVVTSQSIEIIDDSRSARVFSNLTSKVEEGDPEQALGWITQQYEQLVSVCGPTE
ncbi:CvpA family protein [Roseovarius sp. EL26]|uniref:CvpA family protein n=1 Tax=Roseovarius sp. EL26 TaxID=2126672 RepID=UPI000EA29984|nr:CvpA family protein [Roseovarius sp. EL26]